MTDLDEKYVALVRHLQDAIEAAESQMGTVKITEAISDALRNESGRLREEGQRARSAFLGGMANEIDAALVRHERLMKKRREKAK